MWFRWTKKVIVMQLVCKIICHATNFLHAKYFTIFILSSMNNIYKIGLNDGAMDIQAVWKEITNVYRVTLNRLDNLLYSKNFCYAWYVFILVHFSFLQHNNEWWRQFCQVSLSLSLSLSLFDTSFLRYQLIFFLTSLIVSFER